MNLVYTWRGDIIERTGHGGPKFPLARLSRLSNPAMRIAIDDLNAILAYQPEGTVKSAVWDQGNGKLLDLLA